MPTKVAPQTEISIFIYLFCGRNSSFYFPMCHRLSNCRLSEETLRSELQIFLLSLPSSRENRNVPRTTPWVRDDDSTEKAEWVTDGIMSSLSYFGRQRWKSFGEHADCVRVRKKMRLTHLSVHCRSLFCLLVINALSHSLEESTNKSITFSFLCCVVLFWAYAKGISFFCVASATIV